MLELNIDLPRLNVLVAYPYFSKDIIKLIASFNDEFPGVLRLFLDSGAFTAHTTGKKITLDEYCRFIDSLPVKPWRYFALDVIGNEEKTMFNLKEMYQRGYTPVPVYTFNQKIEDIEYYYTLNDFIGYGGLVGQKQSATVKHGINDVLRVANGRKVHLLGYTSMQWIKKFKPYSCDSSSYLAAGRYGNIDVYMGNGNMEKLDRRKIQKLPSIAVLDKIRKLGYNPQQLSDKNNWRGGNSLIMQVSTSSWIKMAQDCEKNIETKMFLAFATAHAGKMIFDCYRKNIEHNK